MIPRCEKNQHFFKFYPRDYHSEQKQGDSFCMYSTSLVGCKIKKKVHNNFEILHRLNSNWPEKTQNVHV